MIDLTTMTARKIAEAVRRRETHRGRGGPVGPGSDRTAQRDSSRLHHGDARRGDRRGRAGGPGKSPRAGGTTCRWRACRWRSRTASGPRESGRPAARRCSRTSSRPRTPRPWPDSRRRAACWSASRRCTRWPTASPAGTRTTATAAIRGTRRRIPGGSSGGNAAALATAMAFAAVGGDTGGSNRQPAALCGVVGVKVTYGRVSRHGGIPLSWSMDTVGPMARTVGDAAALLQVMAGFDPKDPTTRRDSVPDYLAAAERRPEGNSDRRARTTTSWP